jgi:hypothetical protein
MYQQEKHSSSKQVWNPNITAQDYQDLRNHNANLVNLSVPGTYDVLTYQPRTDFSNRLKELVDGAEQADLFVIISLRTAPGRGEGDITSDGYMNKDLFTNSTAQVAFINMWRDIARQYVGKNHVVGYDLLVEPHDINTAAWRALAQNTIEAIREIDPDTPIIIAPDAWGVVSALQSWTPLEGEKLVYSVHQYEPYRYTHNNRSADWNSILTTMYKQIEQWRGQYGVPVVVNEYGIATNVTNADAFIEAEMQHLETYQLSHAAWIWEVEYDADYTYEKFDFKEHPGILASIQATWNQNLLFPSNFSPSYTGSKVMPLSPPRPPTNLVVEF